MKSITTNQHRWTRIRINFYLCLSAFICGFFSFFSAPAFAVYDKPYIGDMQQYRANYEDTFVYLARDYKLGYVEMRAANPGVDPWIPGAGTRLTLPTRHILPDAPHQGLVINLPEMRLYYYRNPNEPPVTFPIGIGREGLETPLGVTKVVRKVEGPVWTPTARMRREDPKLKPVVAPGPDNPMGSHALYLGFPLVAIHGTNRAFGIGRRISSGCIRLYPEDIIALYNMVPEGTRVNIIDQPIKVAWIDDELFLEAHPEVENAITLEETGQMPAPKLKEADMERIIKAAGVNKDRLRWAAIRTALKERRGYPVSIARRPGVEISAADPEMSGPKPTKKEIKAEAAQALKKVYEGGDLEMKATPVGGAAYGQKTRRFNP